MKWLFKSCLWLALFFSTVVSADNRYIQVSDQPADKDFNVYYYFSFHCHFCSHWAHVFEKDLKSLKESGVRVHYAPLSMDRAESLLARGYVLTKGLGVEDIAQDYFNLYRDSYYITEGKVKGLVNNHLKHSKIEADPWSKQSILYTELKIKKYMRLARSYKVDSTPCFVVSGPTGIYRVSPSKNLHPTEIIEVLKTITQTA